MSDLRCEVIRVSWNNVMSAVETFTGTHFYFFFFVVRRTRRDQIILRADP